MSSVRETIVIDRNIAHVWAAVRAYEALHVKLAPGLVTNTELVPGSNPPVRRVTFADGLVLDEMIVTVDDSMKRLVWSIQSDTVRHHNGALELNTLTPNRTEVIWTADVLPDALAQPFAKIMKQGLAVMRSTLEIK